MKYHCEAYNLIREAVGDLTRIKEEEQRIGGFVVEADTMSGALLKASKNIEVAIRPEQYRITVTRMKE